MAFSEKNYRIGFFFAKKTIELSGYVKFWAAHPVTPRIGVPPPGAMVYPVIRLMLLCCGKIDATSLKGISGEIDISCAEQMNSVKCTYLPLLLMPVKEIFIGCSLAMYRPGYKLLSTGA